MRVLVPMFVLAGLALGQLPGNSTQVGRSVDPLAPPDQGRGANPCIIISDEFGGGSCTSPCWEEPKGSPTYCEKEKCCPNGCIGEKYQDGGRCSPGPDPTAPSSEEALSHLFGVKVPAGGASLDEITALAPKDVKVRIRPSPDLPVSSWVRVRWEMPGMLVSPEFEKQLELLLIDNRLRLIRLHLAPKERRSVQDILLPILERAWGRPSKEEHGHAEWEHPKVLVEFVASTHGVGAPRSADLAEFRLGP